METRLDLVAWVDENKQKITNFAKKFVWCSSYDASDFISEAYLIALEADITARGNCKDFEYYFWSLLKNSYRKMTFTKGQRLNAFHESYVEASLSEDELPTITRRSNVNVEENEFLESLEDDTFEVFKEETADAEIEQSLSKMRPLEKEVWIRLLSGARIKDIAEEFGCKRQRIQNIRESGLRRIKDKEFAQRSKAPERKRAVIKEFHCMAEV